MNTTKDSWADRRLYRLLRSRPHLGPRFSAGLVTTAVKQQQQQLFVLVRFHASELRGRVRSGVPVQQGRKGTSDRDEADVFVPRKESSLETLLDHHSSLDFVEEMRSGVREGPRPMG